VPVPVKVSAVEEVWALLVNVSVAVAAPAADGLKVTVNGTLRPALIVTGSDNPLTLNCELLEFAAVTVTFAPAALRLADAVPLSPATTLPNERVLGPTASCPSAEDPEELDD
jgi:siroheme synthase